MISSHTTVKLTLTQSHSLSQFLGEPLGVQKECRDLVLKPLHTFVSAGGGFKSIILLPPRRTCSNSFIQDIYTAPPFRFFRFIENHHCALLSLYITLLNNSIPSTHASMSRSDVGSKVAIGLEHTNLRERAKFYADRNQIETAVFFAGNGMIYRCLI
jgi:hypothetical protein